MHALDPIEASLTREPATIQDLLAGLTPRGHLREVPTRDNPDAGRQVLKVRERIANTNSTGGLEQLPSGLGWKVLASEAWWVLVGHVYPGNTSGRLASDSPVVLLNRRDATLTYGPEVPEAAQLILGNTLAWHAIREIQSPED